MFVEIPHIVTSDTQFASLRVAGTEATFATERTTNIHIGNQNAL